MQILLQLLNYSKKHAQTINIVLLGVIACGGIAGGIHVRNLSTIIGEKNTLIEQSAAIAAQRDALEQQRLAAVEATWQARVDDAVAATATLKREIDGIRADAKRRQTEVKALQEIFERHLKADEEIVHKAEELLPLPESTRPASKQPLVAAAQFKTAASETTNTVYAAIVSQLAHNVLRTREDKLRSETWIKWSDERLMEMEASLQSLRKYPSAVTISREAAPPASLPAESFTAKFQPLLFAICTVALGITLLYLARRRRSRRASE